ncbi:hypothetical protein QR680_010271 [Steinernema hermaphroditum]|uniref:Uncharacterized protein n=1 Tax=Steinernema hermaphroditum TaxID=289476 RepID=A0AA39MAX9_9BILA|nr:hypothetical protein QR680_010271 [Steinernema hermaphroditum]
MISRDELTAFLEELIKYKIDYPKAAEKKSLIEDVRSAVLDLQRENKELKESFNELTRKRSAMKDSIEEVQRQISTVEGALKKAESSHENIDHAVQSLRSYSEQYNKLKLRELEELKQRFHDKMGDETEDREKDENVNRTN